MGEARTTVRPTLTECKQQQHLGPCYYPLGQAVESLKDSQIHNIITSSIFKFTIIGQGSKR